MPESVLTMGFIGGGNMGEAFISALIEGRTVSRTSIWVSDVDQIRLDFLKNKYRINIAHDNQFLYSRCNTIILAVKPQQMEIILSQIAPNKTGIPRTKKRIISIAAGIPIRKIENRLYDGLNETSRKYLPVIRVMPNTPALVRCGISGMSSNRYASRADLRITRKLLESIGIAIQFEEEALDAVTALSGSGPAYLFYLAEAMIEAGIRMGLNPDDATRLTRMTLKGASVLLDQQDEPPEALRQKVTSPGGTTEAALRILDHGEVKKTIVQAIQAACNRARDLSGESDP
ncbi:MAG: pyrroline-5-carboxylate reductase [Thermodesulfobacteriota bacterium]